MEEQNQLRWAGKLLKRAARIRDLKKQGRERTPNGDYLTEEYRSKERKRSSKVKQRYERGVKNRLIRSAWKPVPLRKRPAIKI